jgi:hypothetical protein
MVPVVILDRTFFTRDMAQPEDYMHLPLTLLGLKMQPFNFYIRSLPDLMDLAGPMPGGPGLAPMFSYTVTDMEVAQAKQRRKHKSNCRKK